MDFDSWALGLSSPMKNKKKIFFDSCGKKCPFSKYCMLSINDYNGILVCDENYKEDV